MANPILGVWRCIVRHSRHIPEPEMAADLRRVKRIVRNHRTHARRNHIRTIFAVEQELRKVCVGDQSLTEARNRFQQSAHSHTRPISDSPLERNQSHTTSWKQHESRRFNEYNEPPQKYSAEWRAVDRRARVSNATAAFLRCQPPTIKRSTVVDTVFAPFWKHMQRSASPRSNPGPRPRPVDLTMLQRIGGTLPLLRVRGVQGRGRGLRRHIETVNRDTLAPFRAIQFSIWLAREYAKDPLGDPNMDDWIEQLHARKRELEIRHRQQEIKWEVQRRILMRRRIELEKAWQWRFRRQQQIQARRAQLESIKPSMLRLDTL